MRRETLLHIAATKIGLGVNGSIFSDLNEDVHSWLGRQLESTPQTPALLNGLPSSTDLLAERHELRKTGVSGQTIRKELDLHHKKLLLDESTKRILAHADSDFPVLERLVLFWSNHFTVSATDGNTLGVAGAYERETIRPRVTGSFSALLRAVALSAPMRIYLNSDFSVGPNSPSGRANRKGANENLAREILELHTLGVGGGYSQQDVSELALALTGWTVGYRQTSQESKISGLPLGSPVFLERLHEPGSRKLIGVKFPADGLQQGLSMLDFLSKHPKTASRIAFKLCRHFISDNPDPADIKIIADAFLSSDGDLPTVYRTLFSLDSLWFSAHKKLKTPYEYVVSTLRAMGLHPKNPQLLPLVLARLQQQPFFAPSPAGWPDISTPWLSPAALTYRAKWARSVVASWRNPPHALDLLDTVIRRPSEATRNLIRSAPNRSDALAYVFASHEFQWR